MSYPCNATSGAGGALSVTKPPAVLSTAVVVIVTLSDLFIGALTVMLVVKWRHPILRLSQPLFLLVMACCALVAVTGSLALNVESDIFGGVGNGAFAHDLGTFKCIAQVCSSPARPAPTPASHSPPPAPHTHAPIFPAPPPATSSCSLGSSSR